MFSVERSEPENVWKNCNCRYWAIHNPIDYAQKRTLRLVGGMIFAVWLVSGLISIPPLIGWNDWYVHQTLFFKRAYI